MSLENLYSDELKQFMKEMEKKFISPNLAKSCSMTITMLSLAEVFQVWPRLFHNLGNGRNRYYDLVDDTKFYGEGISLKEALENLEYKLESADIKFDIIDGKACKIIVL